MIVLELLVHKLTYTLDLTSDFLNHHIELMVRDICFDFGEGCNKHQRQQSGLLTGSSKVL